MTEAEMEALLLQHPEKLLGESLTRFRRQATSAVGRADLIFRDQHGGFLVVELKKGVLPRGTLDQVLDYYGALKSEFPDSSVEMMVVANEIPNERRLALDRLNIEHREICEKKWRDVAREVGYDFESEITVRFDEPFV